MERKRNVAVPGRRLVSVTIQAGELSSARSPQTFTEVNFEKQRDLPLPYSARLDSDITGTRIKSRVRRSSDTRLLRCLNSSLACPATVISV